MPVYFSNVAPTCPISRDQVPADSAAFSPGLRMRTVIPRSVDLPSAIAAANIARNIVQTMVYDHVRNNIYPPRLIPPPGLSVRKPKDMTRHARWVEQKDKRVKRRYKYFGKDDHGNEDRDVWVETERIERMVWYDKAWKVYFVWEYGDKGDRGEPVSGGGGGGGTDQSNQ